jgi:hypothetical protein
VINIPSGTVFIEVRWPILSPVRLGSGQGDKMLLFLKIAEICLKQYFAKVDKVTFSAKKMPQNVSKL